MPARTTLARLALSSLLTSAVNGLFFTNPSASTVWSDAAGQPITWQLTKGDPPIGTLILQSYDSQESVVIGDSVSVAALSYSFPSGVSLASDDSQYRLLFVSSADPTDVYSQVGPFEIDAFDGQATGSGGSSGSGVPSNPKNDPAPAVPSSSSSSSTTPAAQPTTTPRRSRTVVFTTPASTPAVVTPQAATSTSSSTTPVPTTPPAPSTTTSTAPLTTITSTLPTPNIVTVMETVTSGSPTGAAITRQSSNSTVQNGAERLGALERQVKWTAGMLALVASFALLL